MREIKLRAWNGNCMLYRGLFDRNWYATPENDENGCNCVGGIHPDDRHNMEVMEWTGLKDKNGTPVFEGDIVEYDFIDGKLKGYIDWDDNRASFAYRDSPEGFWGINQGDCSKRIEVIGNIWQNPELMEQK